MEDNKYYTPEIEEFHVGLEYEVFQKVSKLEDVWHKFTYPDPFVGYRVDKLLEIYTVRVKYLDQKDIEECGFIDSVEFYISSEWKIYYEDYSSNTYEIYAPSGEQVFKGTIKNKSELKRLLKQIGYENS